MEGNHKKYTSAGTDIEEVKRKNAESGMSYNEVKEFIAKQSGKHGNGVDSRMSRREFDQKNNQ